MASGERRFYLKRVPLKRTIQIISKGMRKKTALQAISVKNRENPSLIYNMSMSLIKERTDMTISLKTRVKNRTKNQPNPKRL